MFARMARFTACAALETSERGQLPEEDPSIRASGLVCHVRMKDGAVHMQATFEPLSLETHFRSV